MTVRRDSTHDPVAVIETPASWFISGQIIGVVGLAWLGHLTLGMPYWQTAVAVLLCRSVRKGAGDRGSRDGQSRGGQSDRPSMTRLECEIHDPPPLKPGRLPDFLGSCAPA